MQAFPSDKPYRAWALTRRQFLKAVGGALSGMLWSGCGKRGAGNPISPAAAEAPAPPLAAADPRWPNVLWIVMDTARADHLACYGYARPTTPYLDQLAREGVLYEQAISPAPWTIPAHASMFTGLYPRKHQATNAHPFLARSFPTVAEVLRSYGYRTVGFSSNPSVGPASQLQQGFDQFYKVYASPDGAGPGDMDPHRFSVPAHKTNAEVRAWLAQHGEDRTPFFMFINYIDPHLPYHPPADYAQQFLAPGISLETAWQVNQDCRLYWTGAVEMSEADFAILRSLYDGEIRYLDSQIRDLLDQFRTREILDRTVVIITSDHGENIGDHHLMDHQFCVYDTLLHVPLIIRYPPRFPAGQRVRDIVQTTQIFPTLLDVIGLDWEGRDELQGHSLLEEEPPSQPWPRGLAEYDPGLGPQAGMMPAAYNRELKTVRDAEFKYIWASDGNDELYHLTEDPDELNNVLAAHPKKAQELRQQLQDWLNSFEVPDLTATSAEVPAIDEATRQQLKALGYVR